MAEPKFLVTASEMRAFDATAIQEYGIPGVVLMENAGRSTFLILRDAVDGEIDDLEVAVVAGPGNNGGDGYVIARYLMNHGACVTTYLLTPREKIKGDALINLEILERMGATVVPATDPEAIKAAEEQWRTCDVIVDAILGTGLSSEVRSPYRDAIEAINRCPGIILAADIPSGLDADSGSILGEAVYADITATYGFMKLGMALYPGVDCCGNVDVVDISIPRPAIEKNQPPALLYEEPSIRGYVDLRSDAQAHKGTFGHVLIVGGSPGKTGAPVMAAQAASRVGAGLVTVAVAASLDPILEIKLTEEMTEPLAEEEAGFLGTAALDGLMAAARGKRCVVFGPGLSQKLSGGYLLKHLLVGYPGWIVIDADGLNVLAPHLEWLNERQGQVVLTPHPGEMARLLGTMTATVQQDRAECARKLARMHRVWVVLKGARTITAAPNGTIVVNTTGSPWMASGGQGDILSGMLGGLLVQGIAAEEAVPLAVYLHGLAADTAVEEIGPAPVTATDVLRFLPRIIGEAIHHDELSNGAYIGKH